MPERMVVLGVGVIALIVFSVWTDSIGKGKKRKQTPIYKWRHHAMTDSAETVTGRTVLKPGEPANKNNRLYPVKRFEKGGLKFIPPLHDRWEISKLCEQEGMKVGVEVGVMKGAFALHNLKNWNADRYYLVDAWSGDQKHYSDIKKDDQEANYEITKKTLEDYQNKTVYIRDWSVPAAKKVEDNSVDMIYIDARHDYLGVHEDIEAWWPKLKKNGIMAGHDYVDSTHATYYLNRGENDRWTTNIDDGTTRTDGKAVFSAVNEFAEANDRIVVSTAWVSNSGYRSWLIRK